jgi:diaminopimelate epimerase
MTVEKYNASGNDFVIFHAFEKEDRSALAQKLCHRNSGVGADGLIVILPHHHESFEWEFYNADGSIASMCGNGSRAAALYAYDHDLAPQKMTFMTGAGVISASVENEVVESQLTPPVILKRSFEEEGLSWWLVDTGVPHLVTVVENLEFFDLSVASKMRHAHNANVNYCMIKEGVLYVRTFERGVEGETLACGTGMAASFLRLFTEELLPSSVVVIPNSGEHLGLRSVDGTLFFKGGVQKVFTAVL